MSEFGFFNSDDLQEIINQSSEIRSGRLVGIKIVSGITGGTTNQFSEEITGGSDFLVHLSGVITSKIEEVSFNQGSTLHPEKTIFQFDYETIRGYEDIKRIQYLGKEYNVETRNIERIGDRLTYISFECIDEN